MQTSPSTLVFDIGNVLIGWDPRNLYRKLLPERSDEMEWFLAHVCTGEWNLELDRGRDFAAAIRELIARQPPRLHGLIRAYHERWIEMLSGEIAGSVGILERLHAAGVPLYAITNWNHETFQLARAAYACLERFRGIVVSGEERVLKPDPTIYRILCERYQLRPERCLFIDDSVKNVRGAEAFGMRGLTFESPEQLEQDLKSLGVLS